DDDDEPAYPPPQFISQPGKPAKLSRREQQEAAKLAEAEAALAPQQPIAAPPPPIDDAWTSAQAVPPVAPTAPPAPPHDGPPPVEQGPDAPAITVEAAPGPVEVVTEWTTPPPSVVAAPADTEPLLPSTYHENDLPAAIGS